MHFDLARHQVALVHLVAQNRSQPVQFIKDTIQLVKWALVDNKGSVVRAKGNSDKLTKPLQIHILNFNLNLIKIKPLNQIHSDHTGKLFQRYKFFVPIGTRTGPVLIHGSLVEPINPYWQTLETHLNFLRNFNFPGGDSDCFLENLFIFSFEILVIRSWPKPIFGKLIHTWKGPFRKGPG